MRKNRNQTEFLGIGMRFAMLFLAISTGLLAGNPSASTFRPMASLSGEIRISGSPEDPELFEELQAQFAGHHPEEIFSNRLYGAESTIAGLYTGVTDIAFMARELREPMERMAFQWVKLTLPFVIEIANAGFRSDRPSAQLGVFVHQDNPIEALSLASLDAIFGAEQKRGPRNARLWGDVGASGAWASRPIHPVGPIVDSIAALFFRRAVMLDSRKWNPDYRILTDNSAVLLALRADPAAITFAPVTLVSCPINKLHN